MIYGFLCSLWQATLLGKSLIHFDISMKYKFLPPWLSFCAFQDPLYMRVLLSLYICAYLDPSDMCVFAIFQNVSLFCAYPDPSDVRVFANFQNVSLFCAYQQVWDMRK
jgi:hypothetical protein